MTFYVGTVDAVVDGHLLAIDSEQVRADIAAQCPRRLGRYLGGSEEDLRLSMFRAVWFSPTIEQSDEGQDWYRCDVIALAEDEELAPLGRGLEGALDEEGSTDRYGMCGTADPEDAEFQRVICSADHSWRAIATVDADGKAYPGGGELRAAGEDGLRGSRPRPGARPPHRHLELRTPHPQTVERRSTFRHLLGPHLLAQLAHELAVVAPRTVAVAARGPS